MATTYRIKKGGHYSWPFFAFPWFGNPSIKRRVTLDESCRYELPDYYADNVNKLLGLTFGILPRRIKVPNSGSSTSVQQYKWVGPGHYNSSRFGLVWSIKHECWKILNYSYCLGQRNWDDQLRFAEICRIPLGGIVDLDLTYDPITGTVKLMATSVNGAFDYLYPTVDGPKPRRAAGWAQLPKKLRAFGLRMGFFFGGKLPATHPMKVTFEPIL